MSQVKSVSCSTFYIAHVLRLLRISRAPGGVGRRRNHVGIQSIFNPFKIQVISIALSVRVLYGKRHEAGVFSSARRMNESLGEATHYFLRFVALQSSALFDYAQMEKIQSPLRFIIL